MIAVDAALASLETRLRLGVTDPVRKNESLLASATLPLLCAKAAKRVRARLVLTFAELARGVDVAVDPDRVVECARAVELIHAASLLHDDVVDEADTRRGLPSANARFGNAAAVLVGDHVLATAMQALAFDARMINAAVDVVRRMSSSAVLEIEIRGRNAREIDDATLNEIAHGKTAALFGLCGRLAGYCAHNDDDAQRFESAGVALGLAFQIADDFHDLDDDRAAGSITLPVRWDEIAHGSARERTAQFVQHEIEAARSALAVYPRASVDAVVTAFSRAIEGWL